VRRWMILPIALLTVAVACKKAEQPPAQVTPPPAGAAHSDSTAPASYQVRFETSAGTFVVQVTRAWAPLGADRLYTLVRQGFFDQTRFFRVVPGFVVQFGLSGDPAISARWRLNALKDDPVRQHNTRGTLTFATAGPDTRTTQLFINYADNTQLDGMGFAPVGTVTSGMDVVDRINAGYGERPDQSRIETQGNAYLTAQFPKLDFIKQATIVP
jgi:cyclophilin family peptidyl-prolyl cis-trans isomerase